MNLEQIDTSTTAGKAEVMRLAAEGRRVASRPIGVLRAWVMEEGNAWDWTKRRYAIIAEPAGPREVWGVVFPKHLGLWEERAAAAEHAETAGCELVRYIRADLAGEEK